MSEHTELPGEHPSTYFVQDRENQEEMDRLELQDKMVTAGMGGILPELSDPASLRRVLDVGCGTGGWLIEMARTYPSIEQLFGVDISTRMLEYARARALAQDLDRRVQFQETNALQALPFAEGFFDLVNQRLGVSWLRTWEWEKVLLEYQRVTRANGVIRITEGVGAQTNSPAMTRLNALLLETFHRSRYLFNSSSDGITGELVRLMTEYGIQDVKSRAHTLVYRAGTVEHQKFYEDMRRAFHVSMPFFQKWTRLPSDYEEICQQAIKDMQEPDFVATVNLLTVWGHTKKS